MHDRNPYHCENLSLVFDFLCIRSQDSQITVDSSQPLGEVFPHNPPA